MFDIGFFELMVIAIVGLLVIGPERLPETLRTLALAAGRIKRGLRDTRQEFEKQIGADEIRRQLHNEEILARVEQTRREINQGLDNPQSLGHNLLEEEADETENKMLDEETLKALNEYPPADPETAEQPHGPEESHADPEPQDPQPTNKDPL